MKTKETPTARARRVWDRVAPHYDRDIGIFERFPCRGGREWVCSRVSGQVLEVAVGTGRNFSFYPGRAAAAAVWPPNPTSHSTTGYAIHRSIPPSPSSAIGPQPPGGAGTPRR